METSSLICPTCGAQNSATAQTCSACGKPLALAAPESLIIPSKTPSEQVPPHVRPVGRSAGTSELIGWYRLAWIAVGTLCVLLSSLSRGTSQGNQVAGPDYAATVYAEQTAIQAALPPTRGVTYALAWSPEGTRIASAGDDGAVRIWDAKTGQILVGHAEQTYGISSIAWSPDGSKLASSGPEDGVEVWDAATGQTVTIYGSTRSIFSYVFAWSPDSTQIASSSRNGTVQVWEVGTGQTLQTYQSQNAQVTSLAWSPDGKFIAAGGISGLVETWDATSDAPIYTHNDYAGVGQIAWSPDSNRLASATADNTVQVWDASTGAHLVVHSGHMGQVNAIAWSPDGQALASAGRDTTVQVWKANDGTLLYTYHGHKQAVYAVAWSPTCKVVGPAQPCRIASGGADDVQVWDALTGGDVLTYPGR